VFFISRKTPVLVGLTTVTLLAIMVDDSSGLVTGC